MKPSLQLYVRFVVLLVSIGLLAPASALAQGTSQPAVMQTGSGNVLLTDAFSYPSLPGGITNSHLNLQFGFATAEQALPGLFADSFTISITGPGGTAYLATADVNGVQWAPVMPGAVSVDEASIQRQVTSFLVANEGLSSVAAFQIGFLLPSNWLGVPLTINFDLFDNQNQLNSLAYYVVAVPEPSSLALLLLGIGAWRLRFFRSNR